MLFQQKKMWLGLYALQFLLALFAAIPFAGYLGRTVGQSLDLNNSLGRFDYTFLNDLWLNYGSGLKALMNQSTGFVALYFLAMIFLMGGILTVIKSWKQSQSLSGFFSGAGHFFWRTSRLSIYFLIFQGLLAALFGYIFLEATNNMSPFELESESVIIKAGMILLPIHLVLSSFLFLVHDLAKLLLVHRDKIWMTGIIRDAFKMAFQKISKYYPLYLINIISFVILTAIYLSIHEQIAPTTFGQVLTVFLLGQFYLLLRMGLKLVNLNSLNELYTSIGNLSPDHIPNQHNNQQ